ncbi:helix-turn-helix domain-containing protein, partial [Protofrankia symbiont of Coriaria ruscifolia]|uniref:helix-turn-helix domain-containing protein n=1 Tax=Protofrankia symbiont of Coriaria ruscifolia TaxID=1306542 RepID=UPI0010414026
MSLRGTGQTSADLDEQIEIAVGRRAPYTQLGDWVALSGITDHAKALYWHLSMHINTRRGDTEVWPTRDVLAEWSGFSRPNSIDRYLTELVDLGAIEIVTSRYANGMRSRNCYMIHQSPPAGYTGPTSLAEFYERRREVARDSERSALERTTLRP